MKTFLLLAAVFSQNPVCVLLPGTTPCGPLFKNYPITKPVGEFVDALVNRVQDLNSTAQLLITDGVCNQGVRETIKNLRYQVSMSCGREVFNAIQAGCKIEPPLQQAGMVLCQSECDLSLLTMKALAADRATCPAEIITSGIEGYCNYSRDAISKGAKCLNGVTQEAQYAGNNFAEPIHYLCQSKNTQKSHYSTNTNVKVLEQNNWLVKNVQIPK